MKKFFEKRTVTSEWSWFDIIVLMVVVWVGVYEISYKLGVWTASLIIDIIDRIDSWKEMRKQDKLGVRDLDEILEEG